MGTNRIMERLTVSRNGNVIPFVAAMGLIAGAFHRTGAVEVWGRGNNRVIDACRRHGAASPTFKEDQGFVVVTFMAEIVAGAASVHVRDQVGTKSGLSPAQVEILRLCRQEQPLIAMLKAAGRQNRTKFRDSFVKPLVATGLLELTIPGKPQSRLQKYRTTEAGMVALKGSPRSYGEGE